MITDQKLSQKTQEALPNAMQLFTDREDPQEAFERKLALINKYKYDASGVLCYWGIGGIGKTSFRIKLCHMLNGDEACPWIFEKTDCNYAVFDFGEDVKIGESWTILTRIKEQLEEKKYSFVLFNIALLTYAKKAGTDYKQDKNTSIILDRIPFANAIVSGLGALPPTSWVSNTLQALDQGLADAKEIFVNKKYKEKFADELTLLYDMEATEILENLKRYFIIDMRINMSEPQNPKKAKKTLVIFLDTYERYVDTLNSDTVIITKDYWLWKGQESVIRSIPGVLWVILGRERLTWESGDESWKSSVPEKPLNEISQEEKEALANEDLEQHLIGDLCEEDSISYMKKAGIRDEKLCITLHRKITHGNPLFIYICIEHYKTISVKRTPVLSDFGNNVDELVTRFLQYMPDYYKELSYFLAAIGTWTDEMIFELAPNIKSLHGINKARYYDYVAHSFVIKKLDGTQYIHEVVKRAYLANAGEEIVHETKKALIKYLDREMKNNHFLDLSNPVCTYIDNLLERDPSYDDLYASWDDLYDEFAKIKQMQQYKSLILLCERYYNYIKIFYPQTQLEKMLAVSLAGYLCISENYIHKSTYKNKEVKRLIEEYFDDIQILTDSEDKCIYRMYLSAGIVEFYMRNYKESIKYAEKAYEGLLKLLEENHPDTIEALYVLGMSYFNLKDYNKAKESLEIVYEKRKGQPGEQIVLRTIDISFFKLKEYDNAIRFFENIYEEDKKVLGKFAPGTLFKMTMLAGAYERKGDYSKAIDLREEIYEIWRNILGSDNERTIDALCSLTNTYFNKGDYNKAIELGRIGYEKTKNLSRMYYTTNLLRILGLSSYYLEDYNEAKKYLKAAYEKLCTDHEEKHPSTRSILNALATSYYNLGEYHEAKDYFEIIYQNCKMQEMNSTLINVIFYMADSYYNLKDYNKAKEYFEIVYTNSAKYLSEDKSKIIITLKKLADSCYAITDYEKSKEYYELLNIKQNE